MIDLENFDRFQTLLDALYSIHYENRASGQYVYEVNFTVIGELSDDNVDPQHSGISLG